MFWVSCMPKIFQTLFRRFMSKQVCSLEQLPPTTVTFLGGNSQDISRHCKGCAPVSSADQFLNETRTENRRLILCRDPPVQDMTGDNSDNVFVFARERSISAICFSCISRAPDPILTWKTRRYRPSKLADPDTTILCRKDECYCEECGSCIKHFLLIVAMRTPKSWLAELLWYMLANYHLRMQLKRMLEEFRRRWCPLQAGWKLLLCIAVFWSPQTLPDNGAIMSSSCGPECSAYHGPRKHRWCWELPSQLYHLKSSRAPYQTIHPHTLCTKSTRRLREARRGSGASTKSLLAVVLFVICSTINPLRTLFTTKVKGESNEDNPISKMHSSIIPSQTFQCRVI